MVWYGMVWLGLVWIGRPLRHGLFNVFCPNLPNFRAPKVGFFKDGERWSGKYLEMLAPFSTLGHE